jgi:branched-chain amino acid transport system substrate-binding protein
MFLFARVVFVLPVACIAALVACASVAGAQLSGGEVHIGIGGPLTTGSATFGSEMRNAVDLAVAEKNASGGILGTKIVAIAIDDEASNEKGKSVAKQFCEDPLNIGVVGHVNSGVTIAASLVYGNCGLAAITPMSSNPLVTEQGLSNIFRLTNRDDRKGPGLAKWLRAKMGKRRAAVLDDGTIYGKGLADGFVKGFEEDGGAVPSRQSVHAGDSDFRSLLGSLPGDIDVLFFAGIREGAYILRDMRALGLNQVFACGDGCWSVDGFIKPSEGAAMKGEGVRILSAAPAIGKVPGSSDFAARYTAKYGPINNYAASSYDSARLLLAAIERAATDKQQLPSRADVVAAMRRARFQGVAYARPVEWSDNGDNKGAVIFVNVVEGDRFKEIDQIGDAP